MSAIAEHDDGTPELVRILILLHENVDALSFSGPLGVFSAARHNAKDASSEAFDISFAGPSTSPILSRQGLMVSANMDYKEAHSRLSEFDMLVVPGAGKDRLEALLKADEEPIPLIKAYVELQESDSTKERTILSVDNGSHILAKAGALKGLSATTNPDSYIALELLGQQASAYESTERTDVMDDRYIVNNARFDLGDIDENPFVMSKEEAVMSKKDRRHSSNARKGSFALRESNMRRESNARRAALRLGGMRVVTSGAVASGIDAALYLVCALVSVEAAEEVARVLGVNWTRGVVVNSIDV